MVNEINKIVRNTLLSGKNLFLPGTGSLTVVQFGASQISKKQIRPPYKRVAFIKDECGVSLVDEIARIAGVDAVRAREIYDMWLNNVTAGEVMTIGGVGVVRNGIFSGEKEFVSILNPGGSEPVKVKTLSDGILYVFSALCCLFALGVALFIWRESRNENHPASQPVVAAVQPAPEPSPIETEDSVVAAVVPEPEEKAGMPAAETPTDKNTVRNSVAGSHYVVLGIFSTEENAFNAVKSAAQVDPAVKCSVFRYSDKYMVSLFDSADMNECTSYKRTVDALFPDLWIYTKR